MGRPLPTTGVGYPVAQLGSQLSGGELARSTGAGRPRRDIRPPDFTAPNRLFAISRQYPLGSRPRHRRLVRERSRVIAPPRSRLAYPRGTHINQQAIRQYIKIINFDPKPFVRTQDRRRHSSRASSGFVCDLLVQDTIFCLRAGRHAAVEGLGTTAQYMRGPVRLWAAYRTKPRCMTRCMLQVQRR